jgi:hypothetical protein
VLDTGRSQRDTSWVGPHNIGDLNLLL